MNVDPERVAGLLKTVADDIIMPRFGRLESRQISTKSGPNDLVTEVDIEAEAFLRNELAAVLPATFIGEESAAADPSIVAAIAGPGRFWVADPLDGTRNFVRKKREFATILALVEDGETRMGWIFAAPEGKCAIAVKGEGGSWAGERIAPSPEDASDKPKGLRSTGWLDERTRDRFNANMRARSRNMPGHCSAYAYLKLAFGEIDYKISSRIHPWDHAAGALLLAETCGAARYLDDGARYVPEDSADRALLTVAPGRDWEKMAALVRD